MNALVKILFKGLATVLPIGATLYVVYRLATLVEGTLGPTIEALLGADGLWRYRPGMGAAAALVVVFLVGLLSHLVLFRRVVDLAARLLDRIPLVKTIHGALRDLTGLLGGGEGRQAARQVVVVPFGDAGRLLGLVTREDFRHVPAGLAAGDDTIAVYVPMSYQLGGFTVLVPRGRVSPVAMSAEDAMRFAMTAGLSTRAKAAGPAPAAEEAPQN